MQSDMANSRFKIEKTRKSLFEALVDARHKYGGSTKIIEDIERNPIDYDRLILSAMILGRKLCNVTQSGENVGLMIASSIGGCLLYTSRCV